jgi:hypothetical protein
MNEGWFLLLNARKAHYFRDAKSLCGKWMYLGAGPYEPENGAPDARDCGTCRRQLRKEAEPE